ncbi:YkvA family protein [Chloroflexus sp. Y-396-1]|uniref:YkvA family protein n=1 Tax=Chloroflexus sp. Y-396-1 TaxID=867845 RepID=UPI00210197B6|nr:YkvA family protein [Chloroflexus sp. Y-396-1]
MLPKPGSPTVTYTHWRSALLTKLKHRACALKREAYALYIATRDPRVPWYVKVFVGLVVAHTFSPIDLIPDFIPVLGYLDDLVITPLGIALALRMIPSEVMSDARQKAEVLLQQGKPISRAGALMVVAIWLVIIIAVIWSVVRIVSGQAA